MDFKHGTAERRAVFRGGVQCGPAGAPLPDTAIEALTMERESDDLKGKPAPEKPPVDADVDADADVNAPPVSTAGGDKDDEGAERTTLEDTARAPGRASKLWWALPILMVVEFYAYGHNGRLEICVGKEGETEFSLVGQERTDDNRWKFPRCETRLDLGLRSHREIIVDEGKKIACRGATIFRHQGEAKMCVASENGWQQRVEGHFVPPWDPAYYQHLFWFLQ
jgi:hypothetical protein